MDKPYLDKRVLDSFFFMIESLMSWQYARSQSARTLDMVIVAFTAAGLVFGLGAALAHRFWGTFLALLPIAAWFVYFLRVDGGGITESEAVTLGVSLCGVIVGLLVGQLYQRPRSSLASVPQEDPLG